MSPGTIPLHRVTPQRLLHQAGEALLRRDFADQAAQENQLRWWHTRALHGAWGTAEGLRVVGLLTGERAAVSAGVAFDLFGRELVLDRAQRILVPETADEYLLVLQYATPDHGCRPVSGPCLDPFVATGDVRLAWILRRAFTPSHGVPLAILNEDDTCPPPFARPYVRPHARPKVGYGALTVSSREFTPWRIKPSQETVQIGWEFEVDTSASGFAIPPCYVAGISVAAEGATPVVLQAVARYHIAQSERDRFTIRYFLPIQSTGVVARQLFDEFRAGAEPRFMIRHGFSARASRVDIDIPIRISWIGVEPGRARNEVDHELRS